MITKNRLAKWILNRLDVPIERSKLDTLTERACANVLTKMEVWRQRMRVSRDGGQRFQRMMGAHFAR